MFYCACSENLRAAKRAKMSSLSKEARAPHSASLLMQTKSTVVPPTVGVTFATKLGQQAVAMAKKLTNQLACNIGESGVLTWKEATNWNEVLSLARSCQCTLYKAWHAVRVSLDQHTDELEQCNVMSRGTGSNSRTKGHLWSKQHSTINQNQDVSAT